MAPFKKGLSSSTAQGQGSAAADDFSARRSARVAAGRYAPDNDTWVEALAVCEVPVKPGYGDDKAAAASRGGRNGGGLFRKFKSKKDVNKATTEQHVGNNADATKSPSSSSSSPMPSSSSCSPGEADVAAASQRLTLRPYFQSRNTGNRVWDEPPSGASEILYATTEARKMAQAQLEEMKSTYAHAAVRRRREREERKAMDNAQGASSSSSSGAGASSSSKQGSMMMMGAGSKLIPKSFRRASSASAAVDASQSSSLLGKDNRKGGGRVKGTLVLSDEGGRRGIPKSILQESKDLAGVEDGKSSYEQDLQRAMLMSMGVGGGSVMGVGDHKPRSKSSPSNDETVRRDNGPSSANRMTREEEEQLELAKALSMSEQESRQGRSTRRSKSSSNRRRGGSKGGGGGSEDGDESRGVLSGKQRRSRSRNGNGQHAPSPDGNGDYTNMKPPPILTNTYSRAFDGGGKMPAAPAPKNKKNYDEGGGGDFGDRGPSWEMSWSHSASPTSKDWAMS